MGKAQNDEKQGVIKTVTIQKINLGSAILRKYHVEYNSGVCRTYGVPPETVL